MNEAAARRVLLLRAFEREPPSPSWSEDDRRWATQAAAQVEGERASADAFIARRAALAVERLASREKSVPRLLASVAWPAWVGWAVPALALAAGFGADAVGAGRQVNLLAPPLLALLAWNLAVYALLLGRLAIRLFDPARPRLGPLARWLAGALHVTGKAPRRAGPAAAAFIGDWMQASGRLTAARLGRVLHASAVAFAAGALAGLYLRGLAFEYRAGWESTFLGARAVHGLLNAVLAPASALTGLALPDAAGFEALRFAAGGTDAAPWVHLYAVTVALVVLAPRLALAGWLRLREGWLARRFPLPLDEPYFRALTRPLGAAAPALRIAPYAIELAPQAALNLNAIVTGACGPRSEVSIAPATAFGAEDDIDPRAIAGEATLLAPLFALTATPEAENHGAFIGRLREAARPAQIVALVDESAFRRQFGESARLDERRDAWRRLAQDHGVACVFVDLDRPGEPGTRQALAAALDGSRSG